MLNRFREAILVLVHELRREAHLAESPAKRCSCHMRSCCVTVAPLLAEAMAGASLSLNLAREPQKSENRDDR
jgi:hypothetical protein